MPPKTLEPLRRVPGHPSLLTARKGAARMMAVRLPTDGLALYSPIPDPPDAALAAAQDLGGVQAIIAPSPFHHLGVRAWLAAFPDATLHAPIGAVDRLEKRIGRRPSQDMPILPEDIEILCPDGLKAPEVCLRSSGPDGVAWVVCDAFAGPAGTDDAPAATPKQRGAFATMCIGDATVYKDWAMPHIDQDQPTYLLPAHGNAVAGPDLARHLRAIVESL